MLHAQATIPLYLWRRLWRAAKHRHLYIVKLEMKLVEVLQQAPRARCHVKRRLARGLRVLSALGAKLAERRVERMGELPALCRYDMHSAGQVTAHCLGTLRALLRRKNRGERGAGSLALRLQRSLVLHQSHRDLRVPGWGTHRW